MKINSNISLFAADQLRRTSQAVARSLERLATGKRVSSPSDDVGAYVSGVRLDSQIRGYTQATRNINDAMGAFQTADAAMSSQMDILQRLRELAVQASTGTLTNTDRGSLNSEVQQLLSEFTRIGTDTEFNGNKLLDGSFGTRTLQVGPSAGNSYGMGLASAAAGDVIKKSYGTGKFGSAIDDSGSQVTNSVTGDFNNDGKMDYVSIDVSAGALLTGLGKGDGTFSTSKAASASTTSGPIAAKDFNGDGILDLVVVDQSNGVNQIFIGNGDGTFKTARTVADSLGVLEVGLDTGDINGDGKADFITSDITGTGQILIFLGNGDGSFKSATTYISANEQGVAKLGDMNGDGKLDLIFAEGGSGKIGVAMGTGTGTFGVAAEYGTLASAHGGLNLRDVNGDGQLDVVAESGNSVAVLINNGGVLGAATLYSAGSANLGAVTAADMNGDGIVDLVANSDAGVLTYFGNGNGTFKSVTTSSAAGYSYTIEVQDFNNDGVNDILTTNATKTHVYLGQGVSRYAGSDISVATQTKAQSLIKIVDTALSTLQNNRSNLGAQMKRLDSTQNTTSSMIENLSAARDQMLDIDTAQEVAELTRNQILQQAQVAVLGQANLQMQLVLGLLNPWR